LPYFTLNIIEEGQSPSEEVQKLQVSSKCRSSRRYGRNHTTNVCTAVWWDQDNKGKTKTLWSQLSRPTPQESNLTINFDSLLKMKQFPDISHIR